MYSYWDEDPYFQVGLQGLLLKPPHSMFWNGSSHLSCFSLDIMELKTLKGLALHDILTEVHLFVHRVDFPSSVRMHLLTKMADIEYRLSVGTSEKIQLSSLIAAFQVTRDLIVAEA